MEGTHDRWHHDIVVLRADNPRSSERCSAARTRRAVTLWLAASAIAALCLGAEPLLAQAARASGPPWRIPLVFHVVQREGVAVAPPSFIAEQLAAARAIYGPLGIELVEREGAPLGAQHAELITRADRDALSAQVHKGEIHCFIVAKLMDVDEPGRERRGVHWRPRPAPERSFLIVSQISKPYVLAHELGHWFGNREHSDVPGNLMSYTRTEQPPWLDAAQIQRVQRTLAEMLRSGKLVALPSAPPAGPPPPAGR